MVQRLLLVGLLATYLLAATVQAQDQQQQFSQYDYLSDEFYQKMMNELELDQEALGQEHPRNLVQVKADGSLGSKCGMFLQSCDTGFDCVHNRCIPNRDCMNERMKVFNANFDSEGYKAAMFTATNLTQEDMIVAYKESNGDNEAFANSNTMQSLMNYMKVHAEPFAPVTEIVNSCAGIVSGRRLEVDERLEEAMMMNGRRRDEVEVDDMDNDNEESTTGEEEEEEVETRRLQASPSASPSVSIFPSRTPSISPSAFPTTSAAPSSMMPSNVPTSTRTSTTYLGIHMEADALLGLSLTLAWRDGAQKAQQLVRTCIGGELGASIEFSFYVGITFDGIDDGWLCGSVLFESDAGLALQLGFGVGICYERTESVYVEFTVGLGAGLGIGANVCFVGNRVS